MNYLAHAYLSFCYPEVLLGNMISDYVKGKMQYDYPAAIQTGIKLHRAIDHFTDHHPATKEIASLFHPYYRLYSGAFADVVYDHYLANDRLQFFDDAGLLHFTKQTYYLLEQQSLHFPLKFSGMFPYMVQQNWLYNYQFDWGIQKSFQGLARRAKYIAETDTAMEIFLKNKEFIRSRYQVFFPSVKKFAQQTMEGLLKA